jgi:flagellar biosynthesis protein FlhA
MIAALRRIFGANADIILVALMVGILTVLFTPIPSSLLDFLIITNFSFALLVLLLTFYIGRPVEFSTFPSLLLMATLFRLSLNVAATRLILGNANGGRVIGAIGSFVVGGNYVIGLIVFGILVVVQYVVVTAGAQRVAEVAARFTLDSMPGQQMSIDADLNMGFIDQAEAKRRRKNLEREASFYGAMDGSSKFVKGDAIAGIIILFIDILGGLAIGVLQLGMGWSEALQTYTLLTIGDGIVTQVPALVISVATGIIITRSASDSQLSGEVLKQITLFPKTLVLVVIALLVFGLLPGIPVMPVLVLAVLLSGLTYVAYTRKGAGDEAGADQQKEAEADGADIYETLTVDPVEVRVGRGLVSFFNAEDSTLMDRIATLRKQFAQDVGLVVPKVRIKDDSRCPANGYQVWIHGVNSGGGELHADRQLAIHPGGDRAKLAGIETRDPSYGLPAVWIAEEQRQPARAAGYTLVEPATVFITHFGELMRQNAYALLNRAETEKLVNRVRQQQAGLVEELVPTILSLSEIQKVLQNLLREKVSIRQIDLVLEVLVDAGRQTKDADILTELVRQKLGGIICQALVGKAGDLAVLTLDPAIERTMISGVQSLDQKTVMVLEPRFAEQVLLRMAAQVEKMMKGNALPVLLCAPEIRRHLRRITERAMPHLAVISMSEVPNHFNLRAFGMVTV